MAGLSPIAEAWFIGGYVAFLLVVAATMAWAARHSHDRVLRVKAIGFRYHGSLDAWQCSEGTYLWRTDRDERTRLVRYRAKAEMCNACPIKSDCTDSTDGRELVRPMDAWPHSEMARFQRALSLALVLLAGVLALVEAARQADPWIQIPFIAALVFCGGLAWRGWAGLRAVRTALSSSP
jgi:hypothetical protein